MNLLKELNLFARAFYTVFSVWYFSSISGFSFGATFMGIGWIIFVVSFVFQYYVLYYALKKVVETQRGRLFLLLGWFAVTVAGIVLATFMTPSLQDIGSYESAEAFLHKVAFWGAVFATFSSMFVAFACTRRAFTRHGTL